MAPEHTIWTEWLPNALKSKLYEDESRAFAEFVSELSALWSATKAESRHGIISGLKFTALAPTASSFVNSKNHFDPKDLNVLVETCVDIIVNAKHDVAAQVHWSKVLDNVFGKCKRKISVTLRWRELYDIIIDGLLDWQHRSIAGKGLVVAAVVGLLSRARRYFAADAASEIWRELLPRIAYMGTKESVVSLALLVRMIPIKQTHADRCTLLPDWADRCPQVFQLWQAQLHRGICDSCWLSLVSTMVKNDITGVVDWTPHVEFLFSRILNTLNLPVGTSNISRGMEGGLQAAFLFHDGMAFSAKVSVKHAAKLLIYLLPSSAAGARDDGSNAAAHVWTMFERLINVTEQFYHPSNGGPWTANLAILLKLAVHYFVRRLQKQKMYGDDSRLLMDATAQRVVAAAFVRLASRGQFSKDRDLMQAAWFAFGNLAYIIPENVLPLVEQRFEGVLQSVHGQQLASAIQTLSQCVRPLLLAGLALQQSDLDGMVAENGHDDVHQRARQVLASAMVALLDGGLDANDPVKTKAVFNFFIAVFCNVRELRGHEHGDESSIIFPLYLEEWLDTLLEQLFQLLGSTDSTADYRVDQASKTRGGAQQNVTGWKWEMVEMMLMLMHVLPNDLRAKAVARVGKFLTTSMLPTVAAAMGNLAGVACFSDVDNAYKNIIQPLLDRIKAELPENSAQTQGAALSKRQEQAAVFWLELLCPAVQDMGRQLLPHVEEIMVVLDACLSCAPQSLQRRACDCIRAMVSTLLHYYVTRMPQPTSDAAGPLPWITKTGAGYTPPMWHEPSAEEQACVDSLVQKYLVQAAAQLEELTSSGQLSGMSDAAKQGLKGTLFGMLAVLDGVRTSLPDFRLQNTEASSTGLQVCGAYGPQVCGADVRERAACAITSMLRLLPSSDWELMAATMKVASALASCGMTNLEPAEHTGVRFRSSSFSGYFAEPVGFLDEEPQQGVEGVGDDSAPRSDPASCVLPHPIGFLPEGSGDGKGRKAWPAWVITGRLEQMVQWRGARAAYRAWQRPSAPLLRVSQLSDTHLALMSQIVAKSMHPFGEVSGSAEATILTWFDRYRGEVTLSGMLVYLEVLSGLKTAPVTLVDLRGALNAWPSVMQQLQERLENLSPAAAAAAAAAEESETESVSSVSTSGVGARDTEKDFAIKRAAEVLGSTSVMRLTYLEPTAVVGLVMALCVGLSHESDVSQECVMNFGLVATTKVLVSAACNGSQEVAHVRDVLLAAASRTMASSSLWRHAAVCSTMLLLFAPPYDSPQSAAMLQHSMQLLFKSSNPTLRALGQIGVLRILFPALEDGALSRELRSIVFDAMQQDGFGSQLIDVIAADHAHVEKGEEDGSSARVALSQMSRLHMMARAVPARLFLWLADVSYTAVSDNSVLPSHGRSAYSVLSAVVMRCFAEAEPQLFCKAVQSPIVNYIQTGKTDGSERARECAVLEAMAAVLSAKVPLYGGSEAQNGGTESTVWQAWLRDATNAMHTKLPLDGMKRWRDVLQTTLYFKLHVSKWTEAIPGVADPANAAGLSLMLQWVTSLSQNHAVAHSNQTLKWLEVALFCLTTLTGHFPIWEAPQSAIDFCTSLSKQLQGCSYHPLQSVRDLVGANAAILAGYALQSPPEPCACDPAIQQAEHRDAIAKLQGTVQSLVNQILSDLASAAETAAEDLGGDDAAAQKDTTAKTGAQKDEKGVSEGVGEGKVAAAVKQLPDVQSMLAQLSGGAGKRPELLKTMQAMMNKLSEHPLALQRMSRLPPSEAADRPQTMAALQQLSGLPQVLPALSSEQSADVEMADAEDKKGANGLTTASSAPTPLMRAESALGVGLKFLRQCTHAFLLNTMESVLVASLPALLRAQELRHPSLQSLNLSTRTTLATVKNCTWARQRLAEVVAHIVGVPNDEQRWQVRASALVFLQRFWYLHCMLLPRELLMDIESFVVQRLADFKQEVRDVACSTLSGIMKGYSEQHAATLRNDLLQRAQTVFAKPKRQRRARDTAATPPKADDGKPDMAYMHACVLGLQACVQCSPYDVPAWMPDMLMALVAASSKPPPVRTVVSTTLGDFRRTHEQEDLEGVHRAFTEEQWEAIQGVTSHASYFA